MLKLFKDELNAELEELEQLELDSKLQGSQVPRTELPAAAQSTSEKLLMRLVNSLTDIRRGRCSSSIKTTNGYNRRGARIVGTAAQYDGLDQLVFRS